MIEGLTEFDATFPGREARAVALERCAGAPIQVALDRLRDLRDRGEILVLADGSGTTREHRGRERAVVAITDRLSSALVEPLPTTSVAGEVRRLNQELANVDGTLSGEQREAIGLGCGEHQLVVIEGHAGTGKSTTLTGIARAHQACGREIIVASTAAVAAERLAIELGEHGVTCAAFSTAGLRAAVDHRRLKLTAETTVIHDEAALASTREQLHLLRAIESAGARLIEVGDPRQNQPVGAGGLWTRIEDTTREHRAHLELTVNQRARDPDDRQAQAWLREGEAELAIRNYHARDRIHTDQEKRVVEDRALEDAEADRARGQATIVITQTSNDHLDQLNARAQAIRAQHGELGEESIEAPGRPYRLHPGDQVQIRHTIQHPDRGHLRNGTSAHVTQVDPRAGELELKLADGTRLQLAEQQIADADLRLAYVQHPFPAQGQTTDTAHLIIAEHATREGTYVALTRARHETHVYAAETADPASELDGLQNLANRVNRTEPEMPSIETSLAHERATAAATQATTDSHANESHTGDHDLDIRPKVEVRGRDDTRRDQDPDPEKPANEPRTPTGNNPELTTHDLEAAQPYQLTRREWPRAPHHENPGIEQDNDPPRQGNWWEL